MSDDPLKPEKAVSAVAEIISVAKGNPDARAAGANVAKSLAIVTETVKTVLLPLAALNYGARRAQEYFQTKFESDMSKRTVGIPADDVVAPKASVAGPALQGLAFSHDEEELKDLYLGLLATSMDGRSPGAAHPAFAEVIRQISVDEVKLLESGLKYAGGSLAIASIRRTRTDPTGYVTIVRHVLNTRNEAGEQSEHNLLSAYVDNWVRLGLFEVSFAEHLLDDGSYDWVAERPEFIAASGKPIPEGWRLEFQKGIMTRTEFGAAFARAVGILSR